MKRSKLVPFLVEAIGSDAAELIDLRKGWPSLVEVATATGPIRVSLHAAEASPHSRMKEGVQTAKPYEWRFQAPADKTPPEALPESLPILVGHDVIDGVEILIAVDGTSRVGKRVRSPILFDRRISEEAATRGWAEQVTRTGDVIYAMRPPLFPAFVELMRAGVHVPVREIVVASLASGLLDTDSPAAAERARRAVSALTRSRGFGDKVKKAYGQRCAMCRVGLGVIAGAHIFPVEAPGSRDEVWNGLALCHNHHSAFDALNIWIEPDYSVVINKRFRAEAAEQPQSQLFLDQTRSVLWVPTSVIERPRPDMIEKRYAFFEMKRGGRSWLD